MMAKIKLPVPTKSLLPIRSRLADRVRDALREEVFSGRWEKHLPSERHLSTEFQVGRPTMHLALSSLEKEGILRGQPGQPWAIVKQAISRHQSRPRLAKVILIRNAKVKPDITSMFPLIDSLRQKLHKAGLDLTIVDALMHGNRKLNQTLSAIDEEHRPSFYLLFSVPSEVHRWYQKKKMPALIFGARMPDTRIPAIDLDAVPAMRHAVDYLFRRGHRHIGFLQEKLSDVGNVRIHQQFQESCDKHAGAGMTGAVETAIARPATIKAAIRRLFRDPSSLTAIIVADLELLVSLYTVLGELGLSIPRKVSVVALGYWPILDYMSPLPTCYELSMDKLVNHAIHTIVDYLRLGVRSTTFCKLLPALRYGESVAEIKKAT